MDKDHPSVVALKQRHAEELRALLDLLSKESAETEYERRAAALRAQQDRQVERARRALDAQLGKLTCPKLKRTALARAEVVAVQRKAWFAQQWKQLDEEFSTLR